jgi:hypothetical protein
MAAGGGKALVGLLGLAVGLLVGYGAGRVSTGTPINPLAPAPDRTPQTESDEVQRLRDAGLLPPALDESSSLTGTVVAVTGSRLTFDADLTSFDPDGKKGLAVHRIADLTAETVIVRLVAKSQQELSADQEATAAALADPERQGPPPPPPSPYKEVPIAAADISVGESVTVEAASDILKAETFTATRVVVAPVASTPAPATAPTAPPPETPPTAPPPEPPPTP